MCIKLKANYGNIGKRDRNWLINHLGDKKNPLEPKNGRANKLGKKKRYKQRNKKREKEEKVIHSES